MYDSCAVPRIEILAYGHVRSVLNPRDTFLPNMICAFDTTSNYLRIDCAKSLIRSLMWIKYLAIFPRWSAVTES